MRLAKYLSEQKESIGLATGRFNPFHKGHLQLIQAMSKENKINFVWVVAGAKSSLDKERNPIPQADRIKLIQSVVPSNVKVLGAPNAYIPDLVKEIKPNITKLQIYAGLDRSSGYTQMVKKLEELGYSATVNTKNFDRTNISASRVRELMRAGASVDAQKLLPYPVNKIVKWF